MNEKSLCRFKNFRVNYTDKINIKMAFTGIEFSKIVYGQNREQIADLFKNTNFNLLYFNNIEDTNLMIANYALDSNFLIVCFSGTHDYSIKNIKTNWNLRLLKNKVGRVHTGFYKLFTAFDKILRPYIQQNQILWTGHSRGGVLAALSQAYFGNGVTYSFGCPRFADKEWVISNTLPHYRFAFANDPVQYLPPKILSYKHHGVRIELREDQIFDDIEYGNTDNFTVNDLTQDWNLIRYSVRDWLRLKSTGTHHYQETYSNCFQKIAKF